MDEWLAGIVTLLALVLVVVMLLGLLALRRRWLAREGGTFECSIRLGSSEPDGGWVLGMARYNAEAFEWFRFFSYSARPRKSFRRRDLSVMQHREPNPREAVALYAGQQVVRVAERTSEGVREWDLAMEPESLTGMMSWLEASPPSGTR